MTCPSWIRDSEEVERILHVNANDLTVFLRWELVRRTMFVDSPEWIATELDALRSDSDWETRWQDALREDQIGSPTPCKFYPESSGNLIHHAYHVLTMEQQFRRQISSYKTIAEFGGGYGSLCRLIHHLGFAGSYLIYDLPSFLSLQSRYLKAVGIQGVQRKEDLSSFMDCPAQRPALFLATWSLSETPLDVRKTVENGLAGFDNVLIAYQDSFEGINNVVYFQDLVLRANEFYWHGKEITHLPGNHYLFGQRKL